MIIQIHNFCSKKNQFNIVIFFQNVSLARICVKNFKFLGKSSIGIILTIDERKRTNSNVRIMMYSRSSQMPTGRRHPSGIDEPL